MTYAIICHPERSDAKDLAKALTLDSSAFSLRMTLTHVSPA